MAAPIALPLLGWMGWFPDPKPPSSSQPLPRPLCRHFPPHGLRGKTLPEAPLFAVHSEVIVDAPRKKYGPMWSLFLNYQEQTTGSLISVLPAPPVPLSKVKAWVPFVTVISPPVPSSSRLQYGTSPMFLLLMSLPNHPR